MKLLTPGILRAVGMTVAVFSAFIFEKALDTYDGTQNPLLALFWLFVGLLIVYTVKD